METTFKVDECECPDFCGEFLRDLQVERQGKIIRLLHDVVDRKCVDALAMCEGALKEIEEIDSFLYGKILKEMCSSLLKVSEKDAAINIVNQRLNSINDEDFSTLMILGMIYDKSSEYELASETYNRAYESANQKNDNLMGALSLVKMATSNWQLEQPELSRQFIDRGKRAFELTSTAEKDEKATEEQYLLLLDYYKTMGYLNRVQNDRFECKEYYLKALNVIEKHLFSKVQELKLLSHVSLCYAHLDDKFLTDLNCVRALHIIECTLHPSVHVSGHAGQIMHIMKRLGHAYRVANNYDASLKVFEKTLNIARNFLSDAHPEVARLAADIAVLCHKINQPRRISEFVVLFQKSLKESNYKNDDDQMKLYARELTDAFTNFAECHKLQSNYASALENYEEALDISIKVYGEINIRTAKVMRLMGRTYNKWGKYQLAKKYLSKALAIVEQYQPMNKTYLNGLKKELWHCGPRRPFFKKSY